MEQWENILLALFVVIITSSVIYDKFYLESMKDVHELSLNEQASISSTRRVGESAIYRSLDVMHGLPLTVGLQLRYDVYKIRNGNLKDVWSLAMGKRDNKITFINEGKPESIKFEDLNNTFYKISIELNKVTRGKKIAIHAPISNANALMVLLSSFFYTNHTIQNLTKIPQLKNEDIELICCRFGDLAGFKKLGYERFLVLDQDQGDSSSVAFSKVLQNKGLEDPSRFDYTYSKEDDFQTVFVETVNFKEIEYSQINFVSAIASQLRSLPMEHMWQEADTLMVESANQISSSSYFVLLNQNFLVKLLSAFVAGVSEVIVVTEQKCDLPLIYQLRPTIISVSEKLLHQKLASEIGIEIDQLGFLQRQALKLSSHWFSRGIHNSLFKHPLVPKLRIIYSENYTDSHLSSLLLNYLQSVFSSRLIVEKFKLPLLGPILKTNFFDYRLLADDTDGGKLVLKKLGVPANCLEFKVKDFGTYDVENNEGELVCRGFNIGKELVQRVEKSTANDDDEGEEGWMPLGIVGKWGEDGCFYAYL